MREPPHDINICFHRCGQEWNCRAHCGHQHFDAHLYSAPVLTTPPTPPSPSPSTPTPDVAITVPAAPAAALVLPVVDSADECDTEGCVACMYECMSVPPHNLKKCYLGCNKASSCTLMCH
jgi:hypothetical protein